MKMLTENECLVIHVEAAGYRRDLDVGRQVAMEDCMRCEPYATIDLVR